MRTRSLRASRQLFPPEWHVQVNPDVGFYRLSTDNLVDAMHGLSSDLRSIIRCWSQAGEGTSRPLKLVRWCALSADHSFGGVVSTPFEELEQR